MDTSTGHLISGEAMQKLRESNQALAGCYTPVPKRLSKAALRKLAGGEAAMVPLHSGGKLARWAAHERTKAAKAKRRAKARRRMEKKTRRAQRRS